MKVTIGQLIEKLKLFPAEMPVLFYEAPHGSSLTDHVFIEETDNGLILDGYTLNRQTPINQIKKPMQQDEAEAMLAMMQEEQEGKQLSGDIKNAP